MKCECGIEIKKVYIMIAAILLGLLFISLISCAFTRSVEKTGCHPVKYEGRVWIPYNDHTLFLLYGIKLCEGHDGLSSREFKRYVKRELKTRRYRLVKPVRFFLEQDGFSRDYYIKYAVVYYEPR